MEDGRSHVGKTTVLHLCTVVVRDVDERNRVEGVCRVWSAVRVDGVVGISVVGNDDCLVVVSLGSFDDVVHALVDGNDSLGDGIINTCVTNHVAVCEVHNDEVVLLCVDGSDEFVLHLECAHVRLEVVGRHLWRSHEDAVLTCEWSLATTIEEEGDVSIFLSLGSVQLALAIDRKVFAEGVLHVLLREEDVHACEGCVVRSHAVVLESWDGLHALLLHVLLSEDDGEFLSAVVAVVEEDDYVAFLDASIHVGIHDWLHEFVGVLVSLGVGVVAALHTFHHVVYQASLALNELVVSHLDAVPTLVAVHGIEASDDAGNVTCRLVAVVLQFLDETLTALWVGVASVHETVNESVLDAVFLGNVEEFVEMNERRVHTTAGSKTHEVDALVVLLCVFVCAHDFRVLQNATVLAGTVDFHEVLIDDASCADVEVTHFGVAHLSVRKTYVLAAGVELRVWTNCIEIIKIRGWSAIDDVAFTLVADSPSVENHE